MISLAKSFLFVHVPKTGGNSIQNVLAQYSEDEIHANASHQDGVERFGVRCSLDPRLRKHASLRDYRDSLGGPRLETLYKFAVVRNPWERLISFYFSPHFGKRAWDRTGFLSLLDTVQPLRHYVALEPGRPLGADLDFLLRFEQLEADFAQLCAVLGIAPTPLPRRNASTREHYSRYYDEELRDIVGDRYRDEIEELGYSFERS